MSLLRAKRLLPTLAVCSAMALFMLAGGADACSVCSAGRDDESRWAFIITTVFLSVLPLGIVGGLVFWLRRRALSIAAEDERVRAGTQPPHSFGPASL